MILKDARVWMGGYRVSGSINRTVLDYSAEQQDNTALEHTARSREAGLLMAALQMEGFYSAGVGAIDAVLNGYHALADVPVTVCPIEAAAEGSRCFTFQADVADINRSGAVGDLLKISAGAEQSGGIPLARGQLLHNATRSASGNGSAWQLGALSATQRLVAALHILTADGTTPSLTVKVQSDDNSGFTSATDRITFSAKDAIGYDWGSVSGAITDDYWRASFSISGTLPSFVFVLAAGIVNLPTA